MIRLSAEAEAQLNALLTYYDALDRPEAMYRIRATLVKAAARIEASTSPFFDAPRPYPTLKRAGWTWPKEGGYWFAFSTFADSFVIPALFHEAADMPDRL